MQQALLRKGSNRNTAAGGLEEAISRRCACASQDIEEGGGGNTGNQLGREGRGFRSRSRERSALGSQHVAQAADTGGSADATCREDQHTRNEQDMQATPHTVLTSAPTVQGTGGTSGAGAASAKGTQGAGAGRCRGTGGTCSAGAGGAQCSWCTVLCVRCSVHMWAREYPRFSGAQHAMRFTQCHTYSEIRDGLKLAIRLTATHTGHSQTHTFI